MKPFWEKLIKGNITSKKNKSLYRSLITLAESNGREISINGEKQVNFSSNNYLGLSFEPRIIREGFKLTEKWGAGATASRLICGTYDPLTELEQSLALWLGAGKENNKRALIFNSGYQANLGILSALADKDTVVFCDKLNHASIYDGIVLSRAKMVRYHHKDTGSLEKKIAEFSNYSKKIIITDALFSVDGDLAPLKKIAGLAKENSALLIVDEAHSIGVFGEAGRGIVSQLNLLQDVDILMATFGKGFGAFGAFVYAEEVTIQFLINNARSFIFSTALPPFVIGCIQKALEIIQKEPRGKQLLRLSHYLRKELNLGDVSTGESGSQIVPVIAGSSKNSLLLSEYLKKNGFYSPAIRAPTVPENSSRIRLSVCHYHTRDDIHSLAEVLIKWIKNHN